MLKSHAFLDRQKDGRYDSESSQSSSDVSRDVIGHMDVGKLVGSYYGSTIPAYGDPTFPEHGQDCEFLISTGDLCRATMDHEGIKGWWRHYLITRGPSGMIATPYLATIPLLYTENLFPTPPTDPPIAYSGESITAVNMSFDPQDCEAVSCSKSLVYAQLNLFHIDEDGTQTETNHAIIAGGTQIIAPASDDLSVISRATFTSIAIGVDEARFALFVFQANTGINPDIPLQAT